jgi:hypothetical protein
MARRSARWAGARHGRHWFDVAATPHQQRRYTGANNARCSIQHDGASHTLGLLIDCSTRTATMTQLDVVPTTTPATSSTWSAAGVVRPEPSGHRERRVPPRSRGRWTAHVLPALNLNGMFVKPRGPDRRRADLAADPSRPRRR